ncbi:MAG: hypothetical protein ABIH58_01290 [Patescibacteria group bacterium]
MINQRWFIILGISSVLIALVMQGPQFIHQLNPQSQGILVNLNSDEDLYLARVQEALSGNREQASEAFTGEDNLVGTQSALIEKMYGSLFGWTGLKAAEVFRIMDSVIPILIFLGLFIFFQLCGFTRVQSFGGSSLFVLIELYGLSRPINLRASFLFMLIALILAAFSIRKKSFMIGILAGIFMGLLVGVYFWSWTFAWLALGIFFVWEALEAIGGRENTNWNLIIKIGLVGLIVASPFLIDLMTMMQNPLYEFGEMRSGIVHSRAPESVPYSILFITMAVGILIALKKDYRKISKYKLPIVMVLTSALFIHQQVVHGIVLVFVSHSIFSLLLGAICAALLALKLKAGWLRISALAALVYIAALGYDGRYIFNQWKPNEGRFAQQHFASLIPELDKLPRSRILSDTATSSFIAGHTHHDIVYSIHLKNTLMTHEELAERFCMTQLALPSEKRDWKDRRHLVHPESSDPAVKKWELELVGSACERVDADPDFYLKKFGIEYVVWDERNNPDWGISRLEVEEASGGKGWSLWQFAR